MTETKLTVLITEQLRRQVKAAAALRGDTLSDVVRSALVAYVEETSHLNHDAKVALKSDPLLSLRFSNGPGNVAERADEILNEAADPITGLRIDNDRTS